MINERASIFIKWLKQEVAPALGCTEPVAISFTTAYAAKHLDTACQSINGFISANLYKNATGVTIPEHPLAVSRLPPPLALLAAMPIRV